MSEPTIQATGELNSASIEAIARLLISLARSDGQSIDDAEPKKINFSNATTK